jgi:segregation and condensation protein A
MTQTRYHIQLPTFEGPLDLLLHLVEQEELDITTIALAQVTDQYLAYLAEIERRQASEMAEFLVVAAKLLLIKSNALLPRPPTTDPEDKDSATDLVRQLQIYKRFKEIASQLQEREKKGLYSYVRVAPKPRPEPQLDTNDVTLNDLLTYVQEALDAMPGSPVDTAVTRNTVTISDQISRIEEQLVQRQCVRFDEFLSDATTRVEVVVTLWAVLELVKQKRAHVRQEELFGEIFIEQGDRPGTDASTTKPAT